MNTFQKIAYILLVVGGLNWGLIGFFNINVISNIFSSELSRIIYSFVGVAALVGLYYLAGMNKGQAAPKKK